eukprot:CAMPEP_0202714734 /NCGR_PEP_ID=MMETSP1385-20130828/79105_1 /ASSEMBLY_ACC=CAM_ASM_000861 /TAXON_ID=933848 /ORGANISM="Elphidium margaritaceum" /LENGTH=92 /DNA_ID=CAMNT_0049375655 /DNA_START=220 /DNA_END=495 /DNA_ORIENTATION=-
MQTLHVICPYASRNQYDANGKITFVYDTDDGHVSSEPSPASAHHQVQDIDTEGMDEAHVPSSSDASLSKNGCQWIGAYEHLWHHIDTQCKFV